MILLLIIFILIIAIFVILSKQNKNKNKMNKWNDWFYHRDLLPQSNVPNEQWYTHNWNNGWGPNSSNYPIPEEPYPDIVTISRHYIGLPYQHHHIPNWDPPESLTGKPNESMGLDCSNFTSWVYNYGRGRKFTSDIHKQAEMYKTEPGMKIIKSFDMIKAGDLLYFWRIAGNGNKEISHTGIFVGYINGIPYLIDSHGEGVKQRPIINNTWYMKHFSHAIRIQSA